MTQTKICSKCKIEKPLSEFYFRRDNNSYRNECKKCFSLRHKDYYIQNSEIIKKRQKDYLLKNNLEINNRRKLIRKQFPWRQVLSDIKQRCENKNNKDYKYYGERGIKCLITEEEIKNLMIRDGYWDMKKPNIDRIDNDGDYCIENCRFIEQSNHTIITHSKIVLQYDLQGNFIKEWKSVKEASNFYKIASSAISLMITKNRGHCNGYIWKYKI